MQSMVFSSCLGCDIGGSDLELYFGCIYFPTNWESRLFDPQNLPPIHSVDVTRCLEKFTWNCRSCKVYLFSTSSIWKLPHFLFSFYHMWLFSIIIIIIIIITLMTHHSLLDSFSLLTPQARRGPKRSAAGDSIQGPEARLLGRDDVGSCEITQREYVENQHPPMGGV